MVRATARSSLVPTIVLVLLLAAALGPAGKKLPHGAALYRRRGLVERYGQSSEGRVSRLSSLAALCLFLRTTMQGRDASSSSPTYRRWHRGMGSTQAAARGSHRFKGNCARSIR